MFNFQKMFLFTALGMVLSSINLVSARTRNVIMVIPDGFGPASEVLTRDFVHWKNNATTKLPVDELVVGQVRTRSYSSYVTDSAAAATAYSCGLKSYNGAIGVTHEGKPCGTVLEAAKRKGYKTGLVVTSRITHATPAGFASHVIHRDFESSIASQLVGKTHPLGQTVDILMGGGLCFFLPNTAENSCRTDDADVLGWARNHGFEVIAGEGSRQKFDEWDSKEIGRRIASASSSPSHDTRTGPKRYMGLFSLDHMSYTVDRDPEVQPALTEMALKALDALFVASTTSTNANATFSSSSTSNTDTNETDTPGFFIMIEASRIDHAGHSNDALTHINEILEFNRVIDAVRGWIDNHAKDDEHDFTLVATADHETGGLTLGEEYWLEPSWFDVPIGVLDGGKRGSGSAEKLALRWKEFDGSSIWARGGRYGSFGVSEFVSFLKEEVFARYGVTDPSEEEVKQGMKLKNNLEAFEMFLKNALDSRTKINWSTGGHTAVDVTLYSYSTLPASQWIRGNHENIEVSQYISNLLGLDDELKDVTTALNEARGGRFILEDVWGGRPSWEGAASAGYLHGENDEVDWAAGSGAGEGQMPMGSGMQVRPTQSGLTLMHYHH